MTVSRDSAFRLLFTPSTAPADEASTKVATLHADWLTAKAAHVKTPGHPDHDTTATFMAEEREILRQLSAEAAMTDDEFAMKCEIARFVIDTSHMTRDVSAFFHCLLVDALALSEGRRLADAEKRWPNPAE